LYDAQTDRIVWTAKSETIDGAQFEALAESIVAETTDRLVAMNFVAQNTQRAAAVLR
jgi:hypothetical protein